MLHSKKRRFFGTMVIGSFIAATWAATVTPARAEADATNTRTTSSQMNIVPVSKILGPTTNQTASVNILLDNGRQISIPVSDESLVRQQMTTEAAHRVYPNATVRGDCGSSYVNISRKSNGHPIYMSTGFTVNIPAIGYSWRVYEAHIGGTWNFTYRKSGTLASDSSWNGSHTSIENPNHGTYHAQVESDHSYAILDTGSICSSGGPEAEGSL